MKDEESLGNDPQLGKDNPEGSALDRIETNFMVMLSVRELELATRSTAAHVETMKSSLERQTDAVVKLAGTMELALDTLREVLDEQGSIKERLSTLEQDVAELKKGHT